MGAVTDSDRTLAGPTERIGPDWGYREGAVGGGMFTDYPTTPPVIWHDVERQDNTNK